MSPADHAALLIKFNKVIDQTTPFPCDAALSAIVEAPRLPPAWPASGLVKTPRWNPTKKTWDVTEL